MRIESVTCLFPFAFAFYEPWYVWLSKQILHGCLQFDWDGDFPPRIPQKDLVIYEMHVRGFTKHPSSKVDQPGTYIGMVEKLSYLKVIFLLRSCLSKIYMYFTITILTKCVLNFSSRTWARRIVDSYKSSSVRHQIVIQAEGVAHKHWANGLRILHLDLSKDLGIFKFWCTTVVTRIEHNLRTTCNLQNLGINAIELMPSHEFNELEYHAYNPVMGDYKYD